MRCTSRFALFPHPADGICEGVVFADEADDEFCGGTGGFVGGGAVGGFGMVGKLLKSVLPSEVENGSFVKMNVFKANKEIFRDGLKLANFDNIQEV